MLVHRRGLLCRHPRLRYGRVYPALSKASCSRPYDTRRCDNHSPRKAYRIAGGTSQAVLGTPCVRRCRCICHHSSPFVPDGQRATVDGSSAYLERCHVLKVQALHQLQLHLSFTASAPPNDIINIARSPALRERCRRLQVHLIAVRPFDDIQWLPMRIKCTKPSQDPR